MTPEEGPLPKAVEFSIVIGLVSTEDSDRILQALQALRRQTGGHTYEVIVADRRHDDVSRKLSDSWPEVLRIPCPPPMSLPELRTIALGRARGEFVIVTEDHCVPSLDWLESMARAFAEAPDGTVAVGGCVENGVCDTALDWATFLTEYSYFLEPVHEGVGPVLPGMNVAYRRSVFAGIDRHLLTSGFWETTLHPLFVSQGRTLWSTNRIKLFHCKKFSFRLFASQRYIYSRYYAGRRFPRSALPKRAIAAAASVVLPPLLLFRMVKQIRAKDRHRAELRAALPYLAVFVLIWGWGEMVGYALGSGDALARIE